MLNKTICLKCFTEHWTAIKKKQEAKNITGFPYYYINIDTYVWNFNQDWDISELCECSITDNPINWHRDYPPPGCPYILEQTIDAPNTNNQENA